MLVGVQLAVGYDTHIDDHRSHPSLLVGWGFATVHGFKGSASRKACRVHHRAGLILLSFPRPLHLPSTCPTLALDPDGRAGQGTRTVGLGHRRVPECQSALWRQHTALAWFGAASGEEAETLRAWKRIRICHSHSNLVEFKYE